MPLLGEVKKAKEIGLKGTYNYIWAACQDCRKERWVKEKGGSHFCLQCSAKNAREKHIGQLNSNWKGGRRFRATGYVMIKLLPDDFFRPMADKAGYVFEHRLVVAKHLKRLLTSDEIVHHINGNKSDNRLKNLDILTLPEHYVVTRTGAIKRRNPLREFLSSIEEWHSLLLGFFSPATGQKFWKESDRLKDIVYKDAWYYGLGRYISVILILSIVYIMIRSIV